MQRRIGLKEEVMKTVDKENLTLIVKFSFVILKIYMRFDPHLKKYAKLLTDKIRTKSNIANRHGLN